MTALPDGHGWPVAKDGFRQRGTEMTRIETFTDAAFAFALTLLVISVESVPGTYRELLDALTGLPAFALSFALIMMFWYGHWVWSRRYGLEDVPTILLSAALVFAVLVYVYPLKYLFALMTHWLSGGRLAPDAGIEGPDQLHSVFAIYGVGFIVMALLIAALNTHAWRKRETLGLDAAERYLTLATTWAWVIQAGVGLVSVLLALLAPSTWASAPGFAYLLLPLVMPLYGRHTGRRHAALLAARGEGTP
jgi:uncharacterized membrane protein